MAKHGRATASAAAKTLQDGLVVASHGRHCIVETPSGERLICHPRGKKSQAVVGDRVHWQASEDEGTIEQVLPRRNLFYRQDEIRTKSFAANLDHVLILIAAEPEFSEHQLARALIAAEAERIAPIIALNKSDLVEPFERAWARLAPYRRMHHGVLPLSLKASAEADHASLMKLLAGKSTLVLGPSGSGKSTLTNLLVPGASVLTQEISQALNSGKHTTTSTTWYWIDEARTTGLIDSPGFQEFGLHHLTEGRLERAFPEFRPLLPNCRFYNCHHLQEPGCAILEAVADGRIRRERHALYAQLVHEASQIVR